MLGPPLASPSPSPPAGIPRLGSRERPRSFQLRGAPRGARRPAAPAAALPCPCRHLGRRGLALSLRDGFPSGPTPTSAPSPNPTGTPRPRPLRLGPQQLQSPRPHPRICPAAPPPEPRRSPFLPPPPRSQPQRPGSATSAAPPEPSAPSPRRRPGAAGRGRRPARWGRGRTFNSPSSAILRHRRASPSRAQAQGPARNSPPRRRPQTAGCSAPSGRHLLPGPARRARDTHRTRRLPPLGAEPGASSARTRGGRARREGAAQEIAGSPGVTERRAEVPGGGR